MYSFGSTQWSYLAINFCLSWTYEIVRFSKVSLGSAKNHLAGQEGFEPPTPGFGVRRSTVRATGLHHPFWPNQNKRFWKVCASRLALSTISWTVQVLSAITATTESKAQPIWFVYLVSLCGVCFRQNRQYLLNSSLSGVVRLFLVVV